MKATLLVLLLMTAGCIFEEPEQQPQPSITYNQTTTTEYRPPEPEKKTTTTTTTSTTRTTTTTCPPCICEICHDCPEPVCDCIERQEYTDYVAGLTICHDTENPAWQDGCYTIWKLWRESLGIKVSKFREGSSKVDINLIYTQGHTRSPEPGYICFRDDCPGMAECVIFNRTAKLWAWNDDQCRSSVLRIYKP